MSQTQSSPKPASVTSSNQGRRDHDSANYHLHKDGSTPDKLRSLMRAYLACFACIIPGLALGIPAGLRDHYMRDQMLLPAMGLLPMGLGAIFALIRAIDLGFRFKRAYRIMLPNAEFDIRKHAAFWTPLLECVTNVVFAGTILTALSFFWAIAPNRGGWGWNDAGGAMLDAYATMPMMTAMYVPFYDALIVDCNLTVH